MADAFGPEARCPTDVGVLGEWLQSGQPLGSPHSGSGRKQPISRQINESIGGKY